MISKIRGKIVSPLVVGLFDTNISQCPCLMDSPSSQLDFYTLPNDYQIFYTPYESSQQTKTLIETIFLGSTTLFWQF